MPICDSKPSAVRAYGRPRRCDEHVDVALEPAGERRTQARSARSSRRSSTAPNHPGPETKIQVMSTRC